MHPRAKNALEALPSAIKEFKEGICYSFGDGMTPTWLGAEYHPDESFYALNIDLTYLVRYYIDLGKFTEAEGKNLYSQLDSPDRESWLIAFMIIDNQKGEAEEAILNYKIDI